MSINLSINQRPFDWHTPYNPECGVNYSSELYQQDNLNYLQGNGKNDGEVYDRTDVPEDYKNESFYQDGSGENKIIPDLENKKFISIGRDKQSANDEEPENIKRINASLRTNAEEYFSRCESRKKCTPSLEKIGAVVITGIVLAVLVGNPLNFFKKTNGSFNKTATVLALGAAACFIKVIKNIADKPLKNFYRGHEQQIKQINQDL